MAKIGIYGGSFDPVHNGHLQAARYAIQALHLDRLLMIPAYHSPGKALTHAPTDGAHRLAMLRFACAGTKTMVPDDLELVRGGESYTLDTLRQLKERYPEDEMILFMGTDMFLGFLNWYEPEQILKMVTLGVFCRGQKDELARIGEQLQKIRDLGGKAVTVENPVMEISSTDIRRLLIFDCAGPFLPKAVEDYIREKGLYGTGRCYRALTEQKLCQTVTGLLKPSRVAHVMGCRDTAVALAQKWGADPGDAARAALLHDITKALDGPLQLTLCRCYDIISDEFQSFEPKTVHAFTGSLVAKRIFGEKDAVVSAIRYHTTGKENMTTLEKIIYVADYMEPNRAFPGVERLRQLAFSDLDAAVILGLEMTLDLLKKQGRGVSPESEEALKFLKSRKRDELC